MDGVLKIFKNKRFLVLLLLIGFAQILPFLSKSIFSSFSSVVYASEEDGKERDDFSLYYSSSRAHNAFSKAMGGEIDGGKDKTNAKDLVGGGSKNGTVGNQATFLGYLDKEKDDKSLIGNFLSSVSSANSQTFNYKQLEKWSEKSNLGKVGNGFKAYANYGYLLKDLGVDATTEDGFGSGIPRKVAGFIFLLFYYLACSVPLLFKAIIQFLRFFNPFALLHFAVTNLPKTGSSLAYLAHKVSAFYVVLQNYGVYLIVPILLGIAIAGGFLFGNSKKFKTGIGLFFVRLFFIICAIPLFGGVYTGVLDKLDDVSTASINQLKQVVYMEFVDFEDWALNTRLAPPKEVNFTFNRAKRTAVVRQGGYQNMALAVNKLAGHKDSEPMKLGKSAKKQKWNDAFDTANVYNKSKISAKGFNVKKYFKGVIDSSDLIRRYMNGSKIEASDFEGSTNAKAITYIKSDGKKKKEMLNMFNRGVRLSEDNVSEDNAKDAYYANKSNTIYGNGTLRTGKFTSDTSTYMGKHNNSGVCPLGGLSTVGMYNYLNSDFGKTDLKVYSGANSSSDLTKIHHYSVNTTGSGLFNFLYYIEALLTLGCIAVIGIVYGMSLVTVGFRQGFKLLSSMPFAMLGSIQYIGKFISAFLVLIIEIIASIALYYVFIDILLILVKSLSGIFTF